MMNPVLRLARSLAVVCVLVVGCSVIAFLVWPSSGRTSDGATDPSPSPLFGSSLQRSVAAFGVTAPDRHVRNARTTPSKSSNEALAPSSCGPPGPDDWLSFGHDARRTSASSLPLEDPNITFAWGTAMASPPSAPVIGGNFVHVISGASVKSLDLTDGTVVGSYTGGLPEMGATNVGPPLRYGNVLYVTGGSARSVNAFSAMDLTLLWSNNLVYTSSGGGSALAAPSNNATLVANISGIDVLFVGTLGTGAGGSGSGRLYAFNASTGALYPGWSTNPLILDQAVRLPPAFDSTGIYVSTLGIFGSVDSAGSLYRIDPSTGSIDWALTGSSSPYVGAGWSGVSVEGDYLYATTRLRQLGGKRYKIDKSGPSPVIIWSIAQPSSTDTAPIIGDSYALIPHGPASPGMLKVDKLTGQELFQFNTIGIGTLIGPPPLLCDNYAFCVDNNGNLVLVSTDSFANLEWSMPVSAVQPAAVARHYISGNRYLVISRNTGGTGQVDAYQLGSISPTTPASPSCPGTASCPSTASCPGSASCAPAATCAGGATCTGTVTCAPAASCGGATCSSNLTCPSSFTCSGTVTCSGSASCYPASTCSGAMTCSLPDSNDVPTMGLSPTCIAWFTCPSSMTCDDQPTCPGREGCGTDSTWGEFEMPTSQAWPTCGFWPTCSGVTSCNGVATCNVAATCPPHCQGPQTSIHAIATAVDLRDWTGRRLSGPEALAASAPIQNASYSALFSVDGPTNPAEGLFQPDPTMGHPWPNDVFAIGPAIAQNAWGYETQGEIFLSHGGMFALPPDKTNIVRMSSALGIQQAPGGPGAPYHGPYSPNSPGAIPTPPPPGGVIGTFGLVPGDDIDAFSFGQDSGSVLLFSVTPQSVGLIGTAVYAEANLSAGTGPCIGTSPPSNWLEGDPGNEAAGDIYVSQVFAPFGGPLSIYPAAVSWLLSPAASMDNSLDVDEVYLGLQAPAGQCAVPFGPAEDDIDALEIPPDHQNTSAFDTDEDGDPDIPSYFSLSPSSPSDIASATVSADDILVTGPPATPAGPPYTFVIYADGIADNGLLAGDDLDALCLWDDGDGILDPGVDSALFSLATGSPSLVAGNNPNMPPGPHSPADIFRTSFEPGVAAIVVYASAAQLGLADRDDVDALEIGRCDCMTNPGQSDNCLPGYTPWGGGVSIGTKEPWEVLFDVVYSPGTTSGTKTPFGPLPPLGYTFIPFISGGGTPLYSTPSDYLDLQTTALHGDSITVCIAYDPVWAAGAESQLRMFHYEQITQDTGVWHDVTSEIDSTAGFVCGVDSGLSLFAIGRPCACDCHNDPECDGQQTILDLTRIVSAAFRNTPSGPDPDQFCPYERTDTNCDGVPTVIDVVNSVNVVFRNGNPAVVFCNPCQ